MKNHPFRPTLSKPAAKTPTTLHSNKLKTYKNHLGEAINERKRLAAAQVGASNPIKKHLEQRGEMIGRRIGHLQNKVNGKKD